MKQPVRKYLLLLLLIILILIAGYYRDFIFKCINAILQAMDYEASYTPPPSLLFLKNYSYSALVKLKWGLTILFSLIYFLITIITLNLLFQKRKNILITAGSYCFVMLLSGIFMLIGYLFQSLSGQMYECARYLMGMAQSPVILMILIPALKLSSQEPNNIPN